MIFELKMPSLSPTMEDGKLVSWNVKEGDTLKVGDLIAEVETDKALMEIESPIDGTFGKIFVEPKTESVKVGAVIALVIKKGGSLDELKKYVPKETKEDKKEESQEIEVQKPEKPFEKVEHFEEKENSKVKASPLAKKIAEDRNLSLEGISGSGPYGRIVKADLEGLENRSVGVNRNPVEFKEIEPSSIRRAIAAKLTKVKQEVPHFYLTSYIEVGDLMKSLKFLNIKAKTLENGKKEYKISLNDAIVKAVANALEENPIVNSQWMNGKLRQLNNIDVAFAVAIEGGGLFTPIVQNANQKTIFEVSKENKKLIKKTAEGLLKPNEYNGGSITISNMSSFGVSEFTAIVNPPQSCILAIGQVEKKPIVKNDKIEIAEILTIIYSVDHRILDGGDVAKFSRAVKEQLENPILLFR